MPTILLYLLALSGKGCLAVAPDTIIRDHWLSILIELLIKKNYFYQYLIFRNSSVRETTAEHNFLKGLGSSVPTLLIDVGTTTNKTKYLPVTKRTTINILFEMSDEHAETNNYERAKANVDALFNFPVAFYHSKSLVISFVNNMRSRSSFENILNHAWSRKLLDICILNISSADSALLFSYDPFTGTHSSQRLTSNLKLFPNKVTDTRGYRLKLPYIGRIPYVIKVNNKTSDGTESRVIKYIANILKINFTFVDYTNETLRKAIEDIESGVVNLLSFALSVNHPVLRNFTKLERGKIFTFDSFGAAVSPKFRTNDAMLYAPLKTMLLIIFGIGAVIVIIIVTDRLRISKERLERFDIVQLILGASGVNQPKATRDRFIFISIVFLSLSYLEDIYSTFTDYELSNTEIPLNNVDDILKSKLTPYATPSGYKWLFEFPEQNLDRIKTMINLGDIETCFRNVSEAKPIICITMKSKVRAYEKIMKNKDGSSLIRKTRLKFVRSGKIFLYEPGFPFKERFDNILRRMAESGILDYWFRSNKVKDRTLKNRQIETNNYLIIPLITILIIGETTSTLIFFIELSCKYFTCSRRQVTLDNDIL